MLALHDSHAIRASLRFALAGDDETRAWGVGGGGKGGTKAPGHARFEGCKNDSVLSRGRYALPAPFQARTTNHALRPPSPSFRASKPLGLRGPESRWARMRDQARKEQTATTRRLIRTSQPRQAPQLWYFAPRRERREWGGKKVERPAVSAAPEPASPLPGSRKEGSGSAAGRWALHPAHAAEGVLAPGAGREHHHRHFERVLDELNVVEQRPR